MSECRVTKNTANDTYFPILFFYFSNIIVERFKTTLTSDDAKQKKWFMIPKVASIKLFDFSKVKDYKHTDFFTTTGKKYHIDNNFRLTYFLR